MSGPTGLEPGGARTLIKPIVYVYNGVPEESYTPPATLFSAPRAQAGYAPQPFFPFQFTLINPSNNGTYVVIQSSWGGSPIVVGNRPASGSSIVL